jgi:pullulanase
LGSVPHRLGFKFAYVGSCLDLVFPAKFRHANQSINYVECHDNGTIFDKLEAAIPSEDFTTRLKRVKLLNAATMLSFGIPFFHMGQEIGLTKNGDTNSYKSGDRINKFDYRVLDERPELYHYFKQLTMLRKKYKFLQISSAREIEKMIRFEDLPNGGLLIDYINTEAISPFKKFTILFNPSSEKIFYKLEDYYYVLFAEMGFVDSLEIQVQNLMLDSSSMMIIVKK